MEYKCFYDVKTPCFSKQLVLVADENTLLYSVFEDDPLVNNFTQVKLFENDILTKAKEFLDSYFKGLNPVVNFPLRQTKDDLQNATYQELLNIPFGKVTNYSTLAKIMETKGALKHSSFSSLRIGQVLSKNTLLIFIPCHRVIGKNGDLKGYRGGIEVKKYLLENIEKAI